MEFENLKKKVMKKVEKE